MIKYIIALSMIFSTAQSIAEIPNKFKVYTTGAGVAGPYCRALVEAYNNKYNATATLSIKPGASGLLALLDMLNDTNFSFSCMVAAPATLAIANPTHIKDMDAITPINAFCDTPLIFNTRLSSPFNNLSELVNTKKAITVGQHTMAGQVASQKMFSQDATNVNYKTMTEAIPSIVEGTLDVYIDGGTLSGTGLTKSLGRIGGASTTPGQNLTNTVLGKQIPTYGCVNFTHKKYEAYAVELNARLNIVQRDSLLTSMLLKVHNEPLFLNVPESKNYVDTFSKAISTIVR